MNSSRLALLLAVLLVSCGGEPARSRLAGKTVWRGMGVEEVRVALYRRTPAGWVLEANVKSGYHGSFSARVPPGAYHVSARTRVPFAGGETTELRGAAADVTVPPGGGRVDRVVIQLAPP